MPILTKCSKCRRSYTVIGQRARTTMTWICPRCKRSRNLTRQESVEHVESDEYPVARDLLPLKR
jgi:transposase-like protein